MSGSNRYDIKYYDPLRFIFLCVYNKHIYKMKNVTEISIIVTVACPRGFASAAEMGAFTLLLGLLPNSQDAPTSPPLHLGQ